jgi:hypothetical protein
VTPTAAKGDVFVSYRRADSAGWTGRLVADMRQRFPTLRIFMDLQAVAAGEDFRAVIDRALSSSSLVLIVIGPQWLTLRGKDGNLRLFAPDDLVRVEVSHALALSDARVIPVLVGDARMPTAGELPDALAPLARLHALHLSDSRWEYDLSRLADALTQSAVTGARRHISRRRLAYVAIALAVPIAAGLAWYSQRERALPEKKEPTLAAAPEPPQQSSSGENVLPTPMPAPGGGEVAADLPKSPRFPATKESKGGTKAVPDVPIPRSVAPSKQPDALPAVGTAATANGVAAPSKRPLELTTRVGGLWAGEWVSGTHDRRSREMLKLEVEGVSVFGQNWVEVLEQGSPAPQAYQRYPLVDGKIEGDLMSFCIHLTHHYDRSWVKYRQCFRGTIHPDHIAFRATNYLDHPRIGPVEQKFIARRHGGGQNATTTAPTDAADATLPAH